MFNWLASFFKTPAPVITQKEAKVTSSGFFSTDIKLSKPLSMMQRANALAKTFQKTVSDFETEAFATDSAVAMDYDIKSGVTGSLQQNVPDSLLYWYSAQGFIGYQSCAMISQNWLIDKACSMPASDAIRNGYTVSIDDGGDADPELIDYIRKCDKRYKIKQNMEEFVRFGRIFGVRHALCLIQSSDPLFYEKPFNPDGITKGSYKGITQVDPYWMSPMLDADAIANPESIGFYEPSYWRINGKKYHKSHLIIMRSGQVPDILKPSYLYGGMPLTQQIYERVYAAERSANEAPQLLLNKRSTIIHVDMDKAIANQGIFEQKMQSWAYFRDNYGIKAVGQEEEIEQFDTALADLDSVIMTQFQLVAAIARIPATKLLGTSPKGFGASGDYEISAYHEELESIQTHFCQPLLERHHLCVMRSDVAPKFGIEPLELNVVWEPLDTPTAAELATINLTKAQTGVQLAQSGAIDGTAERERITADPNSGYSGLELDNAEILAAQDPLTYADVPSLGNNQE